jgi:hypothetical protein
MSNKYETVCDYIKVSFFVYSPQGNLLYTENNDWVLFNFNPETQTGVYKCNQSSGAVISSDKDSYFISFGNFTYQLSPLYHGAPVSGTQSLPNGSVACAVEHHLIPSQEDFSGSSIVVGGKTITISLHP